MSPGLGWFPGDWKRSRGRNEAFLSPGFSSGLPAPDEACCVVPMEAFSTDGGVDFPGQQPFADVSAGLPLFEAGDVFFAKITPCMENGKRLIQTPDAWIFRSTNPSYKDIRVPKADCAYPILDIMVGKLTPPSASPSRNITN